MRRSSARATRLVLIALSLAAPAACGPPAPPPVAPPPPPPPPSTALAPADIDITVTGNTCTVTPTKVVIDYPTEKGYPKKVKFKVKKAKSQEVFIVAAMGQTEPDLFGPLPKFVDKTKENEEKEAEPIREPKWNPSTGDFTFTYKVIVDNVICDPDICVRQGGSGCGV